MGPDENLDRAAVKKLLIKQLMNDPKTKEALYNKFGTPDLTLKTPAPKEDSFDDDEYAK